MKKTRMRGRLLLAAGVLLSGAGRTASAQALSNGGFESNGGAGFSDLTGWTVVNQTGSAGSFYAQTGTGTPLFGNLVPAPPEGNFAAMTDGGGAGSYVLYQDFQAPLNVASAAVSFQIFVNNQASDFFAPSTLDFSAAPNQQARVDLLLANSDPFSVAGSDVLLTLFQTQSGDPLASGYTGITTDLTSVLAAHGGETLRLRLAEVNSEDVFNLGIDNVILVVPEPSTLALLLAGGLSGSSLLLRHRRTRKEICCR